MRSISSLLLTSFALAPLVVFGARGAAVAVDPAAQEALSADHSIAKVVDREGVGMARAATDERWRSADDHASLFTGEWLKTGARGANALKVRLSSGASIVLGPGALVELVDEKTIRVSNGDVGIEASEKSPIQVAGPGSAATPAGTPAPSASLQLNCKAAVRAHDGKLTRLDETPKWLAGYEAGQSTEALGSLLATVDGREVPLTLGYHKVTVDVRDQIARTTIEESFENHTTSVLEGVFYFPLPADASISSFGMWIGDELVEGDVVEKERAREIYEQILREKRDPGLLEWTGGNLFKARVYPIVGEKRVKIAYTQVLPKEGDVYAYHYALQSELLRLHPLRQLAIEVHVSSAEPLAAVASPSHSCRVQATDHAASVSFDAQEYTPDKDFELRIATKPADSSSGHLVFSTDRRGDDGYFMARFSAPAAAAAKSSAPVDWLILADTSGSMNGPPREKQVQFVEALLQSLSPNDTLQLATCDVEPRFAFGTPVPASEENRAAALEFLEQRDALGWSDLATAFTAAFAASRPTTQIVYVGDGIPTLGDADPGVLAQQIAKVFEGRRDRGGCGTVHVVVPGSTSDPVVTSALSRLGGGSVRSIGGGTDPMQTATALLSEVTTPAVHDLKIAFEGVSVAAVHPDALPNLPAGRQQIVFGRFDVHANSDRDGKAAKGRVRVTGTLEGRPVEYVADVDLADAGQKESFVPRLWARHHLDDLLTLGGSKENKERIVALSEEFQIATPYTSFLVLESDADRERFQVEKRMRMRNGEEFFAKGRADATFELLQQQMKKAGLWHRGLRDELLARLAKMERESVDLLRPRATEVLREDLGRLKALGYVRGEDALDDFGVTTFAAAPQGGGGGAEFGGKPGARMHGRWDAGDAGTGGAPTAAAEPLGLSRRLGESKDAEAGEEHGLEGEDDSLAVEPDADGAADEKEDANSLEDMPRLQRQAGDMAKSRAPARPAATPAPSMERAYGGRLGVLAGKGKSVSKLESMKKVAKSDDDDERYEFTSRQQVGNYVYATNGPAGVPELDSLFPHLPKPPQPPTKKLHAPDAVLALLNSLDRRALLAKLAGAVDFKSSGSSSDKRGRVHPLPSGEWLLSNASWFTVAPHHTGDDHQVDWLTSGDHAQRGAWRAAWLFGRVREAAAGDAGAFSRPMPWLFGDELSSYADWIVTARDLGDGTSEVRFEPPTERGPGGSTLLLTVDRAKAVVVSSRWIDRTTSATSTTRFTKWVEVAGAWWPTQMESFGPDDKLLSTTTFAIEAPDAAKFASEMNRRLATRANLVEFGAPPKDLASAKQAVADGNARFEDEWTVLRAALVRNEPDAASSPLALLRRRLAGKVGLERVELAVLARSRRNEELRQRLLADTASVTGATPPRECELGVVEELLALASGRESNDEQLALLRAVEPIFRRVADRPEVRFGFDQRVVATLAGTSRVDEHFAAQKKLATDWPEESSAQTTWAQALAEHGELDAALAWLDASAKDHAPWDDGELDAFFSTKLTLFWNGYRLDDLVAAVETRLRETSAAPGSGGARRPIVQEWPLDQYLSAVVMLDHEAQWWSTIEQWLGAARAKVAERQKLDDADRAKVTAAIRQAMGQGYSCWWYDRRFEPKEAEFLTSVARAFANDAATFPYAQQILGHGAFAQTPAARVLFAELYARVERDAKTIESGELARFVNLLRSVGFTTDAGEAGWQKIFDVLLARFVGATDEREKNELEALVSSYGRRELQLAVLRHRFTTARDDEERGARAHRLLTALVQEPWTAALEEECLRVLPVVGLPDVTWLPKPGERDDAVRELVSDALADVRIVAWYDFVNWDVTKRAEVAVAALPDVNSMPRRKLNAARDEQTKLARAAVRERLAALILAEKSATSPRDVLPLDFLELDHAWLSILLKKDVEDARTTVLTLLKSAIDRTNGKATDKVLARDAVLAARGAATLLHLLAKELESKGAALGAHEQELAILFQGASVAKNELADWRGLEWQRLVALDRGDELEAKLAEWFGSGDKFVQMEFGRDLAWIRAERAKLEAAVDVMVQVAKVDELSHDDWLALADWQTALGRKEDAARSKLAAWVVLDEGTLNGWIYQATNAVRDRGDGVPAELAPEVPDQFVALMRKSTWPGNHLWQLQNVYARTKDFRLLQCLPEALLGHTQQGVYNFLGQLHGIQGMVDEEATVDRVMAELETVRDRAKSDVDRRALDLLRFLAQWKAATQRNGGGPHADAALAAMKSAFTWPLTSGEPVELASYLVQLGALAESRLRAEQLRELGELVRGAASGGEERLTIALCLAQVQWAASQRDAALRTMESELAARRTANGGRLPDSANGALTTYANWLEQSGDYAAAEKTYRDEMAVAANQPRWFTLENWMWNVHVAALRAKARTSLGQGRELYDTVQKQLRERALARTNEGQATLYVQVLQQLWLAAKEKKLGIGGVGDDVERFADGDLPRVLATYQYRNGQSMVSSVGGALHETAGAAAAVEFLVTRAENEPHWLVRVNQQFFDQHGWEVAQWRRDAGSLSSRVERRLLALLVTELRAEMRFGKQRMRVCYDQRWDPFWREKRREFGDAAKLELAEGPEDDVVTRRVADYLYQGLSMFDDAIASLESRRAAGRLSIEGVDQESAYLVERGRWKEAAPILVSLVQQRPEELDYRMRLLRAYHGLHDDASFEKTRAAAESSWRERKLWNEATVATFATTTFDTQAWERSQAYYAEAIALHVKSAPNRGVGDGTLAEYYGRHAVVLANLGRTSDAVDAAAGAVVSWGRRQDQREKSLAALDQVLAQAEDLDAYVAQLDAETKKSGLENPTIRKALGRVWFQKSKWEKAAAQFKLALEVEGGDVAAHQKLVECYDKLRKPELAVAQLFLSMEQTGHDLTLMRDLGQRLVKLGDVERAERVHTNMVEMLANESESHAALAQVRSEQGRHADAADQWRQVVRVRSKEPSGWLGLARASLKAGDRKTARDAVEKVLGGEWDARFGDVKAEARAIAKELDARF